MRHFLTFVFVLASAISAYAKPVEVVLLQLNDVYEIMPTNGGKVGGLARVATIKKDLLKKNPNTFSILAGDFLNPSASGLAEVDGKRLAGKQMVSTLNAAGLDLAVFGNHEFDLNKDELDERIKEARFGWISGNVRDPELKAYAGLPESLVKEFKADDGSAVRVGFVATTIDKNKKDFVRYLDPVNSIKEQARKLRPTVDVLVAVTHLDLGSDMEIARQVPEVDLILGGHEHENILIRRGERMIPIAKADANAKSVYLHVLRFDPDTHALSIDSAYRSVGEETVLNPEVERVTKEWMEKVLSGFRAMGFDPTRVVAQIREALDGRESSVREHPTALTELLGRAMITAVPGTEFAVFYGSMVRLDDVLQPGPLTEYDVLRVLPFPDRIVGVGIKGAVLQKLIEQNPSKRDTGSFVQFVSMPQRLVADRVYRVAMPDFMATRLESKLEPGGMSGGVDARKMLIQYLNSK